jgi:DNA-binding transcriptional ArsR family regulator
MTSNNVLDHQARLLSALSNEKRLQILKLIMDHEMGVSELADRIGLSQSALSQHLAKLRAQKLVTTRRDSQNIYYSSKNLGVRTILTALEEIYSGTPEARKPFGEGQVEPR